jgi:outer membrane protein TolC
MVGFLLYKTQANYLKESARSAKRLSDLSMLQYKEGTLEYQRVLDSNLALTQQQDQYAQARGEIVINLIAFYKALAVDGRCALDRISFRWLFKKR